MQEIIKTAQAPQAIGPYNQAIKITTSGVIYTAGQLGIDPQTGNLAEGVSKQTQQALTNLSAILQAAGSSLTQVVKTTVYLKNMADFGEMNNVYAGFFPSHAPARSTVEVARLPKDGLVEIEAIAISG
jgi:2-iminobutanoate/2-iminopropanoate deaminase